MLDRETTTPPVGAALLSVTEQRSFALSPKLEAEHTKEVRTTIELTKDRLNCRVDPLSVAVRAADWSDVKLPTATVKDAEVAPCRIVMPAGTVTIALSAPRATVQPLGGAGWLALTLQVAP